MFGDTASFDFPLSPDTTLPTALFGRSAAGFTTGLLSNATRGRTTKEALVFAPAPPNAIGANGPYPSVVGTAFGGGGSRAPSSAVVINLGAAAYALDAAAAGAFATFETLAAPPTAAVNNDAKVAVTRGLVPAGGARLTLPPFSITQLRA